MKCAWCKREIDPSSCYRRFCSDLCRTRQKHHQENVRRRMTSPIPQYITSDRFVMVHTPDRNATVEIGCVMDRTHVGGMLQNGYFETGTILRAKGALLRVRGELYKPQRLETYEEPK